MIQLKITGAAEYRQPSPKDTSNPLLLLVPEGRALATFTNFCCCRYSTPFVELSFQVLQLNQKNTSSSSSIPTTNTHNTLA